MKNFCIIKRTKDYIFASVDVRCGFLWLRHRRTIIFRHLPSSFWRYLDTGDYTPGRAAEILEAAVAARGQLES